jgi:chromosomal replication initiation ATPase DnaA
MNPHTYIGLPTIVQEMHKLNVPMDILQLDINIKGKTLDNILEVVCHVTELKAYQLRSNTRKNNIMTARHLFFYIAHKHTKKQIEVIGRHLNRHHATVLHACNKIENQLMYSDVNELVNRIEAILSQVKKVN